LRVTALRTVMRWGSILPVLVLVTFLATSPASRPLGEAREAVATAHRIANPVPVVVVVLDELPAASLLTPRGDIDAELFPNFDRLRRRFTWFRNTTTRYSHTTQIMPSVLSGKPWNPDGDPVVADYPDNLFTLLGDRYDTVAREEVTWLCPPSVCRAPAHDFPERFVGMLHDAAVVGQHVALPNAWTGHLPPVDAAWRNFRRAGGVWDRSDEDRVWTAEDPRVEFRPFLESFSDAGTPVLRYYHAMAPHHPFQFLPEGYRYPQELPLPAYDDGAASPDDEFYIAQAHARHLLQVGYVDRMIGDLLDALEAWPLYDDALVAVLADHGISFRAGYTLRTGREGNKDAVAHVPLFVKTTGQREGRVDDRPAMISDLLPTVAGVLDVEPMWQLEGRSLFDPEPDPQRSRLLSSRGQVLHLPSDGSGLQPSLDEWLARFGPGGDWEQVYSIGPYADLRGGSVAERPEGETEVVDLQINHDEAYRSVDTSGESLPALLNGRVQGDAVPAGTWLAVALNGQVASTTMVHEREAGPGYFSAMIPPSAFVDGDNGLALYRIGEAPDGAVVLHPLRG
ncbi:MAG: sulfatase-like hydrolase/transferase, partial [Nitriliruptorales bacterium]|nr:sulfatase-like hydrolase/transferase [Nitriliruptorales bacterium]